MKNIKECTVAELEAQPTFQALLDEYGQESRMIGMPEPKAKMSTYYTLEKNGSLVCFGGFVDGTLRGFVSVLSHEFQKYSAPASVSESIFVSEPYRRTGIGHDLIRTAKRHAASKGSPVLLMTAPVGSALAELLEKSKDCVETNRVFCFNLQPNAVVAVEAMSDVAINKVRELEAEAFKLPQVALETTHVFHAGMYARTIKVPAGVLITGALIKVATLLIVEGDAIVYMNDGTAPLIGYHVLSAAAGRKQAFLARKDTHITMVFPTEAKTVRDAEDEFTDEADNLQTRRDWDTPIKGDTACLAQ